MKPFIPVHKKFISLNIQSIPVITIIPVQSITIFLVILLHTTFFLTISITLNFIHFFQVN